MKKTNPTILFFVVVVGSMVVSAFFTSNTTQAQTPATNGVTLVKEIYNHTDVPFWLGVGRPFYAQTAWLSGGYFVVSGQCGNQEQDRSYISAQGNDNNKNVQGGLYVFKEDGTLVGRRNVCYDGGMPGSAVPSKLKLFCAEGQACDVSMYLTPTSPTSFVRELYERREYGFPRPLIHYSVKPSGVTVLGKTKAGLYLHSLAGTEGMVETAPRITSSVRVGDAILATKREPIGNEGALGDPVNVFFDLPSLRETDEVSIQITPIVSVGDYVIAYEGELDSADYREGAKVYRITDRDSFEEVQQLPASIFPGVYEIDSANPSRIALLDEGAGYKLYEAGANGLTLIRSLAFATDGASPYPASTLAIAGEYAAVPSGAGFKVYKGNNVIATVTLPLTPVGSAYGDGSSQTPIALEMSPQGYILAASPGYIYLYKINGAGTPTLPPLTGGGMLQFIKNVWQNSRYGQNGEERFPGLTFWLSDGYFVVTDGWCTHQTEKGGFKVFREDGTLVGEANTCTDSLAPGEDQNKLSLWSHVWGTGNENYGVIDGNSFVIGGQAGASWKYPPKTYSVSNGGVSMDAAAWKLLLEDDGSDPPRFYTRDDAPSATGYGVIGNNVVAEVTAGSRSARPQVVVYSTPSLSITKEDTQGLRIFAHIGSYIIAQSGTASGPVGLYRLTDESKLESVQTLLSGEHNITPAHSWRGGFRDPLDPTRFALREASNSRTTSSRGDIHIYKLEGDEATEVAVRETRSGSRDADPFALFGESVIYATCSDNENDQQRMEMLGSCKLILDNNGVIAEANLPRDIEGTSISGISVSRSGRIMVIANANAYLYQIGATTAPGGPILPPLTPTSVIPGTLPLNGIMGTLDLAKGYLLLLQALLGRTNDAPDNDPVPVGTSTQFQSIFKEAADAIGNY